MINMFISLEEENFLKVTAEAATLKNRQTYTLPRSDDIEVMKEDLKRERAPTLSVVEPTGTRRRPYAWITIWLDKINATKCDSCGDPHRAQDRAGCSEVACPLGLTETNGKTKFYMHTWVEISTWNNFLDTRHTPTLCRAPLTMSIQ